MAPALAAQAMDAFIWTSSEKMNAADIVATLTDSGYYVRSVTIMNRHSGKATDKWGSPLVGPDSANYLILQPISDPKFANDEDTSQ